MEYLSDLLPIDVVCECMDTTDGPMLSLTIPERIMYGAVPVFMWVVAVFGIAAMVAGLVP